MSRIASRFRLLSAILILGHVVALAGCQGFRLPGSSSTIPGQWEPEVEEEDIDPGIEP
jgi:hypothetical protein